MNGVFWCKVNQKMGYVKGYKKALTNIKDTSNFTIVLLRTMVCVISRITTQTFNIIGNQKPF